MIYVFAKEWQGDKLHLDGLRGKVTAAKKLVGGDEVSFQQTKTGTELTLAVGHRDPFFTVIALTLESP